MFTLTYPTTGSSDTIDRITEASDTRITEDGDTRIISAGGHVELPNPEFGDSQQINTRAKIRTNRGGEVLGVRDTNWPTDYINTYSFVTICDSVISDLVTFLDTYAGLEIKVVDHLSQTWHGVILTPSYEIVEARESNANSFSMQFRGVKQ